MNSRRFARKRATTIKKTNSEHPIHKRMKTGNEDEWNKDNAHFSNGLNGGTSRGVNRSGKKIKYINSELSQDQEEYNHLRKSQNINSSFKTNIKGINCLGEKSLKLRRCETEQIRAKEDLDSDEDENSANLSPDQMKNEIMKLRKENSFLKAKISSKKTSVIGKKRILEKEELIVWRIAEQSKEMEKKITELSRNLTISKMKKSMIKEALVKYIIKSEEQQKKEK